MGITHPLPSHGHQRLQGAHDKDAADTESHSEQAVVDLEIQSKHQLFGRTCHMKDIC